MNPVRREVVPAAGRGDPAGRRQSVPGDREHLGAERAAVLRKRSQQPHQAQGQQAIKIRCETLEFQTPHTLRLTALPEYKGAHARAEL